MFVTVGHNFGVSAQLSTNFFTLELFSTLHLIFETTDVEPSQSCPEGGPTRDG